MSEIFDHSSTLKDFPGYAPIFPLPEVVLFPHALLPLHIFEPRYRQMISDSLQSNRLVVLAQLRPGYRKLYESKRAPVFPTACLGRVTADQKLPDGRYYLILEGVVRVTIEEEIESDRMYRIGKLKLHRDRHSFSAGFDPEMQRERLLKLCRRHLGEEAARKGLMQILESNLRLGTLCDILSYACPLSIGRKQALLEEFPIERRSKLLAQSLVELLRESLPEESFPPQFSLN